MSFRFQMRMFTFPFNISQTCLTIITHLIQLNKMNIKTNLLGEYVNFVDNTKKQNKYIKIFFIFNCYNYVFNFFFSYFNI